MKKTILVPIITGVLALAIGFSGGSIYQKSKTPVRQIGTFQMGANGTRTAGTGANRATGANTARGGAPVSGTITSMDATSITVQSSDGSSKIVLLSDQTKINKTTDGTTADLKQGQQVMVIGSTTNGAITAESISLGNNFMRNTVSPTPTTAK